MGGTDANRALKVAVVIPCYNEAESIAQVIEKFPIKKLAHHGFDLDVFVVDNNSRDNTSEVAKNAGALVVHEPRQGKGYALRTGFRILPSDVDFVVMLDGDDSYDSCEILRMLEPLQNNFCDMVVGSRLGGRIQKSAMPRLNRFGNWLFTTLVRIVFNVKVSDVLTGYFAWKKSALDALHPHLASPGFAIEMEMITKMARLGHGMTSVPISYHPRAGMSSLHPFIDGLRILKMLTKNIFWHPSRVRISSQVEELEA